ncbi:MAG: hypothetical protein ABSA86_07285 [Oryzomonas sp.]|jgi:DNA ligase-1
MIDEIKMMHGRDYAGQCVNNWLMSEKLNGCRAYWDGQTMWSRGGKEIRIPDAMRAALPDIPLDGEMYAGRDGYEIARQAVQYGRFTDAVRFVAFDLPGLASHPFYHRYGELAKLLSSAGVVSFARHHCCDINSAVKWMNLIHSFGGEGVVLRDPDEGYIPGYPSRTLGVLKLKEAP